MAVELSQLNYFRVAARTGNISKAAQELFLTQPSLSRSIARLEAELGVPLFEHRKGRVVLNEYGRVFLSGVENALGELATCTQTVRRLYENSQNMLSLGCSIDGFLPDVLPAFSRAHPGIGIRQFQYDRARLTERLLDRTLSLAVTDRPLDHGLLAFLLLGEMPYGLFLHRDHPLAGREPEELEALRGQPLICDASRLDLRSLREACRARGFEPLVAYEVESTSLVFQLLERNAGVALMPQAQELRLRTRSPDSPVVVRPLRPGLPPAGLGVAYHAGYALPEAADTFIAFVRGGLEREAEELRGITPTA